MANPKFIIDSDNGISGSLTQLADGTSYLVAGEGIAIVSQSNGQVLVSSLGSSIPNVNVSGSNLGFYSASPVQQANGIGQIESMGSVPYTASSVFTGAGSWQGFNVTDLNFAFVMEKLAQIASKVNAIDTCLSQVSGGIGITQ